MTTKLKTATIEQTHVFPSENNSSSPCISYFSDIGELPRLFAIFHFFPELQFGYEKILFLYGWLSLLP